MGKYNWYKHGVYIGDPSKEYTISIADHRLCNPSHNWHCHGWSSNLQSVAANVLNCRVVVDHEKILKTIPEPCSINNKNWAPPSFFMINDHLFMFVNTDCPLDGCEKWMPHYGSVCSAFFVLQFRSSYVDIFNKCGTPSFPLPLALSLTVSPIYLENKSRQMAQKEKDISVFFSGRLDTRIRRQVGMDQIKQNFPNSYMNVSREKFLSSKEYCDLLCRSKIVWCPRSVLCRSHPEENGVTGKELDAMCAQSMVVRHALNSKEQEPRIPGTHFVEMEVLEKDMLEKLRYYLDHDDEREEIAYNGRLWYERNLAPMPQANFVINRCLEVMGDPFEPWEYR